MKYKHVVIVLVIGIILTTIGALFKILHWPGSSITLSIGMLTHALSGLMLIYKLLTSKNDILNK